MTDKAKQQELARRMLEVSQSEIWQKTVIPYLEDERAMIIELMTSMTDALQLMRYAGSIQTLQSLIRLEARAKQVVESGLDRKLERFA